MGTKTATVNLNMRPAPAGESLPETGSTAETQASLGPLHRPPRQRRTQQRAEREGGHHPRHRGAERVGEPRRRTHRAVLTRRTRRTGRDTAEEHRPDDRRPERPAELPPLTIDGKPNYNMGPVKFATIASVLWGVAGFTVGKKEDKLGIRASSTCELLFDGCRVPRSNVLGEVGKGYKVAIETLNEGRIGIGAQMIGVAGGALAAATAYLKERKQFGKALAEFQAGPASQEG